MHCSTPPIKLPSNRNPGPSRPWITKELLSSIKEKHKKYRIYLKHKSDNNWRQFTTIRNNVTTLLRNAKSVFVQSTSTNTQRNTRLHHIMKCFKQKATTPIPDLYHPHTRLPQRRMRRIYSTTSSFNKVNNLSQTALQLHRPSTPHQS